MSKKLRDVILISTRYNDVVLAALIVMIISLIIVPVPTWGIDSLLALNLTIGALLLMISLYIPGVLSFSTFPSLLLFTTLFRLALNITTTRRILLDAEAGHIIDVFGHFVVAGNFIVGAVIFIIILIVQFIVITKGSERVAEVAARFTLDAMPGKQMSIDADLRAGIIDVDVHRQAEGVQRTSDFRRRNPVRILRAAFLFVLLNQTILKRIITRHGMEYHDGFIFWPRVIRVAKQLVLNCN